MLGQGTPEEASREEFFPTTAGGYELIQSDNEAQIPAFQIDVDGWHAEYQAADGRVDVFVYWANELEKEAIFARVRESGGRIKTTVQMDYRLYFYSSEHHQNHVWWMKGWLLLFRTEDQDDREPFVRAFLQATSAAE